MESHIVNIKGTYLFSVDGKLIDSLAMKSFRPTEKNVGDFYKAGIRIFHVYCSGLMSGLKTPYSLFGETWFGDHNYDFTNLDKQIEFFKKNAPEGYVFINIHVDTRDWWLKENPNNPSSFTHLSQVACNEKWRKDTADYIKTLIKHVEEKYNDFVIGYFLLGGYTTEWFSEFDHEETHPNKVKAFRTYCNNPNIDIPSKDILEQPINEILIKNHLDEILLYRKFHNDLIADTVLYFVKEAQSVINHKKILGLFFGYLLELLYARMWEAGHIELDKINHCKDIDLIATPSSYQFRSFDGPGAFMLLSDSLALNEKACFISFDHTTFLVPSLANNKERLCHDSTTSTALKNLAEMRSRNKKDLLQDCHQTIQAMRREFMQKIYKRVGYWWFDMFEGWFYDKHLMDEIEHQINISNRFMFTDKSSISEVAVFMSSQSLYYMNKNSEINTETICNQRGGLGTMGAPYDIYSLNDINKIDLEKYKLLIFDECILLNDEQREIIANQISNNKFILFIGPVDYARKGIESTRELLKINLKDTNTLEKAINCNLYSFGYENEKNDNFYSDEEDVSVLGKYSNSNLPGFIKKGNTFFAGIGNLTNLALKEVLKFADVHIYNDQGLATFIVNNFIGVYAPSVESCYINLKEDGEYEEIFSGKHYVSKNRKIILDTSVEHANMLYKVK